MNFHDPEFDAIDSISRTNIDLPWLFAYGTLQDARVRMSVFGRAPEGAPDELCGFEVSLHPSPHLGNPDGSPRYLVARFTGNPEGRIAGTVYEVSENELHAADAYETNAYRRILVRLESGRDAWVYVMGSSQ